MKVSVRVAGWAKVTSNIEELERRITRGSMRGALTKSGRIMAAKAKAGAPIGRTGLLKKSIKQGVKTNQKKNTVIARIGASTKVTGVDPLTGEPVKPSKYLHLVEFGTASRGSFGKKGESITPGNPPKPFMRQAFESTKSEVRDRYFGELQSEIKKTAAKIYKTFEKLKNQ